MAAFLFNVAKVEVSDDGTTWTDLGATKGGVSLNQSVETVEIYSDQSADPVEILVKKAPKNLNLNLLDASPSNLALAFGGTVAGSVVSIPKLPTGATKQIKITTQDVGGVHFEILIKKGRITGESEINLTDSDATTVPLKIRVLEPDDQSDPVEITQV